MFNIFSRKPSPPDPSVRIRVQKLFSEFEPHLEKSMHYFEMAGKVPVPGPFTADYDNRLELSTSSAVQALQQARAEVERASESIHQAIALWPSGRDLLNELLQGADILKNCFTNHEIMANLWRGDGDMGDKLRKNRELGVASRQMFMDAVKHIEKASQKIKKTLS